MAQLLQSIGAIVVGAFLGWEIAKIIYIFKHRNDDINEEEEN